MHVILALCLLLLFIGVGYVGMRVVKVYSNQVRLQQIIAIYDNLKLEDTYKKQKVSIFGDKRTYDWDKSRTFASSVEYTGSSTPTDTRAAIRTKVKAAGYSFVQTEYEGSIQPIDEYKNTAGNWIRVAVMSQYVHDKFVHGDYDTNNPLINHANESPSYITLKVNLDDNNE